MWESEWETLGKRNIVRKYVDENVGFVSFSLRNPLECLFINRVSGRNTELSRVYTGAT
jgi:hypothetical protein